MKKAIAYARFSPRAIAVRCTCGHDWKIQSPRSAEIHATCAQCGAQQTVQNCESCESQLTDLRQYAAANDYQIIGEYSDLALSGGDNWEDRPGMLAAAAVCKSGMFFLVRNYDRLFRDVDKATVFRTNLETKNVEIISASPQEAAANGSSIHSKLIRFVILWKAELDREITKARTKAKMLAHQAAGRRMSARTPYGTMIDPADSRRLVPCREEAETISTICYLRRQKLSYRQIARELDTQKIKRRGASKWTHGFVKAILDRHNGHTNVDQELSTSAGME
jgi:site-specific DNA recombinase